MKNFNSLVRQVPRVLFEKGLIRCIDKELIYDRKLNVNGKAQLVNMYCLNRAMGGANLLSIDSETFEMMENVEINLTLGEYSQPWPVVVFEIPNGRLMPQLYGNPHKVELVILVKESNAIFGTVWLSSDQFFGFCFNESSSLIENDLDNVKMFAGSLEVTDAELSEMKNILRGCFNASVYACGISLEGGNRTNEKYYQKLLGRGDKFSIEERRAIPKVWTLKWTIVRAKGGSVSAHWRRGHWRNQRHGPGLSLVKKIMIEAMFIGGD